MAAIDDAIILAQGLFEALEDSSCNPPGVTRASFSNEEDEAHRIVARAAVGLGMTVTHDLAGNQYMTLQGADDALPAIFIGSHLDTVDHGGNYDGAAGVILGLATTALLRAAGVRPRRNLTVMAIRGEELVWFPTPYCGSRMAFGLLGSADYESLERPVSDRS
ncbi:MAG: M28 family peptidase, partial [Pseudomonadota bacterium]